MKKSPKKTAAAAPPAAKPKPAKPAVVEGIAKRDIPPIRKKLQEMREQLLKTVKDKQERDLENIGGDVGDEADQATSSQEKEMLFELSDNERVMLDQIEGSLRKMEKGAYGLCESCQKPIAKARIQAVPFARYCIQCQSTAESAAA